MSGMTRRGFISLATAAASLASHEVFGLGRIPVGGSLRLHVPFRADFLDPHDPNDALSALVGSAVFDSLFATQSGVKAPYPALAAGPPERDGDRTIVRLREGLRTARDVTLTAEDVIFSIERARARSLGVALSRIPRPRAVPNDPLGVDFGNADPDELSRVLASPLSAIVTKRFDPEDPDGTGAFRALLGKKAMRDAATKVPALVLNANPNAARGSAFLDRIVFVAADDFTTSLRAFEAGEDDLGWLGNGLHKPRAYAKPFDFGLSAWVVLLTGPQARGFGLPGVAQEIASSLDPEQMAHLGLGRMNAGKRPMAWGGPNADLLFDERSTFLREVATTVSRLLSRPSHVVRPSPVGRTVLEKKKRDGEYCLALDVVRPVGSRPIDWLLSLAAAESPTRAREINRLSPPVDGISASALSSTLRVGVIGELRAMGATAPHVMLMPHSSGEGWDLGSSYLNSQKGRLAHP